MECVETEFWPPDVYRYSDPTVYLDVAVDEVMVSGSTSPDRGADLYDPVCVKKCVRGCLNTPVGTGSYFRRSVDGCRGFVEANSSREAVV